MAEKKYLVNGMDTDGGEWSRIMTAGEIFRFMEDCHNCRIDIWKINGYGEALTECSFLGKWVADMKDPQRMEIRSGNTVEDVGYGEEH